MKEKKIPEHVQKLLKTLIDQFDKEDLAVRERQIRLYKKLKLYWSGFQRVWWDSVAHDWRVWDDASQETDNDSAYYDKPINVFRAYLESIIAALSIQVPNIRCVPDNADNPLDISTAKAGNKIYQLVSKHNNAQLLWLEMLWIFCTEGLVHVYNYTKEDKKYGTYEVDKKIEVEDEAYKCPFCDTQLPDEMFTEQIKDEFQPDDEDVFLHDLVINEQEIVCPECAKLIDPNLQKVPVIFTRFVGKTRNPKSRQCIEVYGGLFVKTPTYAKTAEQMPYLKLSYECHYSMVVDRYNHLKGINKISSGTPDNYEVWGRLSTQYNGEIPRNMVTVDNWWFPPSSYYALGDDEDGIDELKRLFPDGVRTVFCNDQFGEAENECMHDCWTLSRNPMSDYLQYDPLGLLLVSIQDITNDMIALTLQTIEQGIPQTFADPAVFDAVAYRQSEAAPGSVYPTKPVPGSKNIGEAFTQLKTSSLSPEVMPFGQSVQSLGQLAVGAQSSIFGGEMREGSQTASEYAMSRAQALQRLQNTWKIFTTLWKELWGKVIPMYIKDTAHDDRFVSVDRYQNYVNVVIQKAELQGKLGDVELETSEQLPIAWAQKRDIVKELLQLNLMSEFLLSPENLPMIKEAFGLDELEIPGEADRQKTLEEIQILVQTQPISQPVIDPMTGMPVIDPNTGQPAQQEMPSVQGDPELDNHQIAVEVLRNWLISEVGRQNKVTNAPGYYNVLLKFKEELTLFNVQMQQQMIAQANAAAPEQSNNKGNPSSGGKNNEKKQKMPTADVAAKSGESNARLPVN